jgi:dolichol-phosphate mannosyltransferase
MSVRFVKFALVGASGTIINLCAFFSFARLLGLRDWRMSALATLFANLTNYVLNNAWTFVDQGHRGWSLLRGYVTYLGFSLVGMCASTLTFAGLTRAYDIYLHPLQPSKESYILALGFQFVAILVGTVFNYELNKRFTWRDKGVSESKFSDPKGFSRDDFVSMEESSDQASSIEHNFRRMPLIVKDKSVE